MWWRGTAPRCRLAAPHHRRWAEQITEMRRIARLLTAVIGPTLIASLIFLGMSIYHDRLRLQDTAVLFGLFMIYGTVLWAVPGFAIWLITDSLWKANSSIRRPMVFAMTCGLLGLLGGLSLNLIAWLIWDARTQMYSTVLFGLVGAIATAITALPLMKMQK